ncbi:MAG: hypothetical protein E6I74_05180 [Chloroflexi bacterium]|nr:MAG: hypothetical protein E6I74_05180 [Chloroflexota bacterium]
MDRLTWLVLALVLVLGGIYLLVLRAGEWLAYLVAGVGGGIGLALIGSIIHDSLAGQSHRSDR